MFTSRYHVIDQPNTYKKNDEDKYSLGGQGQDPKAGLVGPLTQPVQLEGKR